VVHGRKRNPKKAHKKLSNARSHRDWSTNHQIRIPARGPTNIIVATRQHIRTNLRESLSGTLVAFVYERLK
jgi:hypothetical protein